jgi:hypothetical protein
MIQITDKLLAILVPEKSKNHSLTKFKTHTVIKYTDFLSDGSGFNVSENNGDWNVELLNYKIVGTISKDGEFEFDCERYVEKAKYSTTLWKDYRVDETNGFDKKEHSFISLLQSKGIPVEKLNMKLLILEKHG